MDKKKIMDTVLKHNPDLSYLKDKKFHLVNRRPPLVEGLYYPLSDSIIVFTNSEEEAVYALSHEMDHAHYRKEKGLLRTLFDFYFHRPRVEHRATERCLRTLNELAEYNDTANGLLKKKIRRIRKTMSSRNPYDKLISRMYYKGLEIPQEPKDKISG